MTSYYRKGEFVLTNRAGAAPYATISGRATYTKDEELLITSVSDHHLNVKRANGSGYVFRIGRDAVRRPGRPLGQVPEGSIPADDPRIAWLFEDAMRLADRLGLCSDFDRIADALGVPGRTRTFNIKVAVAEGIEITAKVEARSKKQAQQIILEQMRVAEPSQLKQLNA
jgi:hypothetical protein